MANTLTLVAKTRSDALAMVESMPPEYRSQVSAGWLARVNSSPEHNPWVFGFTAILLDSGLVAGTGGFKAPPHDGVVEIAYVVNDELRGRGLATQLAAQLVEFAFSDPQVLTVIAHTLPDGVASQRVLLKCGFTHKGEVIDPEDGLVWRFEKHRSAHA